MKAKALYVVSITILSLFAVSSFAAEQIELNGKYRAAHSVCSDDIVYDDDGNVLPSLTENNDSIEDKEDEITLNFLDDGTTVVTTALSSDPSRSGSYTARYTIEADGEFKYLEMLNYDLENPKVTKEDVALNSIDKIVVSVNDRQLIFSYFGMAWKMHSTCIYD